MVVNCTETRVWVVTYTRSGCGGGDAVIGPTGLRTETQVSQTLMHPSQNFGSPHNVVTQTFKHGW